MKLQFATWLLSFAALSVSSADAAGVRGKDDSNSKRRVLQGNQEARYLIQEIQYEHDASGRRLFGNGNGPERLDAVELPDGLIYTVEGFVPPGWTMSGQNVFLPPNTVIDESTATITLPNSAAGRLLESGDAEVPKVEKSLTEEQQRNLAELNRQLREGDRSVLAVKIVVSDGTYGYTPSYLECKVFGTSNGADCGDTYHLANGYRACSYDKLRFNKVPDRSSGSSTVTDIVNGVVTVTLSSNVVADGDGVVRNAVTSALNTAFGTTSSSTFANHMMYCLPPNTMSGIAYAYINSQISVYSNNWCNNVSVQLHEIGHNIGLAHSNEAGTYKDQSGMMGYSYNQESGPRMCFNAAKNFQLGWYSDKYAVVTPGASTDNCFAGNLHGTAFYGDPSVETVGIKVNNSGSSTDVYIMFNAKVGIQSGTVEGGNTVMVVTAGAEGTGYAESELRAKLIPSTTGYSLPGFSNTVLYVDSRVDNQYATIRIETGGQACVPPAPTPPPTPAPTPKPTTAAPTNPPTPFPTNPPTFPQPTPAPTPVPPTNPPTPPPTFNCEVVTQKNLCNNYSNCVWSGNPKNGFCLFNNVNPPPPTPPPTVDPNAPPTTPPPTSNCPVCAYSPTGTCCAPKTCISSGKPANRGCF